MRKFLFFTTYIFPLITFALILHLMLWVVRQVHWYFDWVAKD